MRRECACACSVLGFSLSRLFSFICFLSLSCFPFSLLSFLLSFVFPSLFFFRSFELVGTHNTNESSEKKDTEFLNSIKTAYELSNPFALHGTDKDLGSIAALFQRNKEILDSARSLVQKFEDVAQRIKSQDTTSLTANNWKEEDEALASLLEAGRKVGVDKCQSLMTASTERRLSAEEARAAKILYNRGQPGASGWGKVARKQEKAVRKLAKASEVDHDD